MLEFEQQITALTTIQLSLNVSNAFAQLREVQLMDKAFSSEYKPLQQY